MNNVRQSRLLWHLLTSLHFMYFAWLIKALTTGLIAYLEFPSLWPRCVLFSECNWVTCKYLSRNLIHLCYFGTVGFIILYEFNGSCIWTSIASIKPGGEVGFSGIRVEASVMNQSRSGECSGRIRAWGNNVATLPRVVGKSFQIG